MSDPEGAVYMARGNCGWGGGGRGGDGGHRPVLALPQGGGCGVGWWQTSSRAPFGGRSRSQGAASPWASPPHPGPGRGLPAAQPPLDPGDGGPAGCSPAAPITPTGPGQLLEEIFARDPRSAWPGGSRRHSPPSTGPGTGGSREGSRCDTTSGPPTSPVHQCGALNV